MARRVFFSFHYEHDIWRANVVRKSWVTQEREAAGFWDASLWEKTKLQGEEAIKRLIRSALQNTSVTAVLIGAETASRPYVRYEIEQSIAEGKGLLGVHIAQIANQKGDTDALGTDPFASFRLTVPPKIYYWHHEDGYKNFGAWVEAAATAAGR